MRARVLRILFVAVALLGVLVWILPWALYANAAPFPGLLPATVVFFLIVTEKLWTSFLRMPAKVAVEPEKDWTAIAVGFGHASVFYAVLAQIHFRREGFGGVVPLVVGGLLYGAGLALKMWGLRRLGTAWSVQLDKADANAPLIREGPYRFVRHPIYAAAMLEALGEGLLFASAWGTAAAVLLFWPAEIARARFEETFLRKQFGAAYDAYAREVPSFFPRSGNGRTA